MAKKLGKIFLNLDNNEICFTALSIFYSCFHMETFHV
jgi:hypothetical protein